MKNFLIILLCWVANVEALELKMSKPRNIIMVGDFQSKQEDRPLYTIRILPPIITPEFIILEGLDDNLQTMNNLNNKQISFAKGRQSTTDNTNKKEKCKHPKDNKVVPFLQKSKNSSSPEYLNRLKDNPKCGKVLENIHNIYESQTTTNSIDNLAMQEFCSPDDNNIYDMVDNFLKTNPECVDFFDEDIVSGSDGSVTKFCSVFDPATYTNFVQLYKVQIKKMDAVSYTGNIAPQKFFCRGFSNIMLIDEGTTTPNKTYILNAKSDIKEAIAVNKLVDDNFKIGLIEDHFLSAIFTKYSEVATKGMTDEQKTLIANAITGSSLQALQAQVNSTYGSIDEQAGTVDTLANKALTDLNPEYTSNPLPLLLSIQNPSRTDQDAIAEETATLRNIRVTEQEMNATELSLDGFLDALLQFEADESL
ncbi:MAG: hypothetical protein ACI9CD_000307 [Candidatus Deianiraeaceae bacterium]|jgi:hypothetical protein